MKKQRKKDMDKTLELIPVNVLHSILFDENEFIDFCTKKGNYIDIDKEAYVDALNDYMNIIFKLNNDLDEKVFERINYINKKNGMRYVLYNYKKYLRSNKEIISFEVLDKILNDDEYFEMFMDFNNNREQFNNMNLIDIIGFLRLYVSAVTYEGNLKLPDEVNRRYEKIKKKYVLEFKTNIYLNGDYIYEDLDQEFVDDIMRNIDLTQNAFTIAYSIYIELNKRCCFDVNFLAYNQDIEQEFVKDIYEKSASEINKKNNSVVCRTWAIIYQNLLNKCGIPSVISGDFHKYVAIDCDGTLIRADGTNVDHSDDVLHFDDIFRCQMNLPTKGFECIEYDKDISEALEETRKKINYEIKDRKDITNAAIEEYRSLYMSEEQSLGIYDKIEIILNTIRFSRYKGLELMQYFKMLYQTCFTEDELKQTGFSYIALKTDEKNYRSGLVLTVKEGSEFTHFIYEETSRFIQVPSNIINEMLNTKSIVLMGKQNDIMGVNREAKHGLS